MGSSITSLPIASFQNMDTKEFDKCLSFLGAITGFSNDQMTALALLAKSVRIIKITFTTG